MVFILVCLSDAWLLAVAHYFGARFGFDKADRYTYPPSLLHNSREKLIMLGGQVRLAVDAILMGLMGDILIVTTQR
ncbi:PHD finger protein ALFIN-LIKE 4 [Gossypium hirsutum]|uniref:PHD finger protein ALFIN-LIKE 4 n=1 Tax=Gossypium hirsutum TaxID=3635 RepID=A0ABM3AU43_GOSHI|nr:PHD finger protein ALFIN-LIKE 4-like [Gossypium hirsutum]